jgi:hypothetical protein
VKKQTERPPTFSDEPVAFIIVTKHVICPEGFVCPSAEDFLIVMFDEDARFIQPASADYSSNFFHGSETGTTVGVTFSGFDESPAGSYHIIELPQVPPPEGLILHRTNEGECVSLALIGPGETKKRTLINEYRGVPPTT